MSHITGGGFTENIPRIFTAQSGLGVTLDLGTWELPPIWRWMMKTGNISAKEMARTFNCGVGMVIVVGEGQKEEALKSLRENGEKGAFVMGQVTGKAGVEYEGMDSWEI
jgi:phosphoribosylamine--glycine ligase/phosphoribosylformylglycinamidine cyclo-ligase